MINRPQITIENISEYVPAFKRELDKITDERKEEILEAAEILIKYEGYIGRERIIADKLARLESIKIKVSSTMTAFNHFRPKPGKN